MLLLLYYTVAPTERPTTPPITDSSHSSSSSQPDTSGLPTTTSQPPPSSPSDTDSTRSYTTEPGRGNSEGQTGDEQKSSFHDLGVGLGTVIVVVFIVFIGFVSALLYFGHRARRKVDQVERASQFLSGGTRAPLCSLSSPTSPSPPTHTKKKSNIFQLPTKQCNLNNNTSSLLVATKPPSIQLHNVSPSVNEFIAEPEFYPVSPKRVKPTKPPSPEELTKCDGFHEFEKTNLCEKDDVFLSSEETGSDSGSSTPVSTTIEIEIEDPSLMTREEEEGEKNAVPLPLPASTEKPSRSCLSSVSDSSQGKPRRVTFVENVDESSLPPLPPPPLPPREIDQKEASKS